MKRIKISKNFYLDEFVPRVTYNKWGEKSMWFLDDRLVLLAQFFRDYFSAPMLINNWGVGSLPTGGTENRILQSGQDIHSINSEGHLTATSAVLHRTR